MRGLQTLSPEHEDSMEINGKLLYIAQTKCVSGNNIYGVNYANKIRHNLPKVRAVFESILEREEKDRINQYDFDHRPRFKVDEFGRHLTLTDSGNWEEMYA